MRMLKALCLTGLALAVGACQDLEVENVNQPDRTEAIGEPKDVESLIGGAFYTYWNTAHKTRFMTLGTLGDEVTSSWGNFGMQDLSSEPRKALQNSASYSYREVVNGPWYGMYKVLSSANDGLQQIAAGLKIVDEDGGDNTLRAKAFAKYMQGMSLGYLGLYFDKAFIYTDDIDLNSDRLELRPYKEVVAAAVKSLEEAAALAKSGSFTLPNEWIRGRSLTSDQLAQLAHSHAARFMALSARSTQERDAVDWNKVVSHIDQGITADVTVEGDGQFWWSGVYYASHPTWGRADYKLVGPADKSGNYAAWLATPVADRKPFKLTSDDRRVQSATGGPGKYFRDRGPSVFRPDRGTYHFSDYWTIRWVDHLLSGATGPMPFINKAEMDLLKAEALIRKGDRAGAAALINKTRVAKGELPALTGSESAEDLMAYMKYEKRFEALFTPGVAYWDYRGWRTIPGPGITGAQVPMPAGTMLHFPIPAKELEVLKMEIYTFGGGGEGSALLTSTREQRFNGSLVTQ